MSYINAYLKRVKIAEQKIYDLEYKRVYNDYLSKISEEAMKERGSLFEGIAKGLASQVSTFSSGIAFFFKLQATTLLNHAKAYSLGYKCKLISEGVSAKEAEKISRKILKDADKKNKEVLNSYTVDKLIEHYYKNKEYDVKDEFGIPQHYPFFPFDLDELYPSLRSKEEQEQFELEKKEQTKALLNELNAKLEAIKNESNNSDTDN